MEGIRELREKAGLSQARLAALTGIAQSNLCAYESGARKASPAMRKRIADAMIRPSQRLHEHRDKVLDLIYRHGGRNPRLFGSLACGKDTPESDIDILVDVDPEMAWEFVSLQHELEQLLDNRVDVVSSGGLQEKHQEILTQAVPL
ncbi:MAG: XRE family transcriptional regulator [Propionibacteriaceae bacterium]|nr:XRE family transcriptional regulator [Propionibacteriaceae bacterium]